jgi:hypothetical protein
VRSTLERLAELVAAEGEPLSGAVREVPPAPRGATPAAIAAAGPRASAAPAEYELLVEAIYEGFLLHHGEPRIMSGADADLALLAGDRLYTIGLERLVALGDLPAVSELADLITLCSLLVAHGERSSCEALWRAGARAVGYGSDEGYAAVKALVLSGDPGAPAAIAALDARSTVA